MEIVVFWLGFSVAIAVWASNRGRSGLGWFLISVLVSPLLAAIFLAVTRNLAVEVNTVSPGTHGRCPACSEPILLTAKICKHCHSEVEQKGGIVAIERKKTIKDSRAYKVIFWTFFCLVAGALALSGLLK